MNRGTVLVATVIVLVGVAGIAAAGPIGIAAAQDDPVETNETEASSEDDGTANGTDDISPGERLSGVIGVQRAEINGEVESRAFEVGLNRTETPEERADLVAERLNRTEERLEAIEERQRALRERRAAGELSQGEFAARMAETSARAEAVKRGANRSAAVARDLPEAARTARGINVSQLETLRDRAGKASGPEVAAIARGVAGTDVGGPLAADRRGPPADRGAGPRSGNGSTDDRPGSGDGPGANRSGAGGGPIGENDTRGGPRDGPNRTTGEGDPANRSAGPTDSSNDAANRTGAATNEGGSAAGQNGPAEPQNGGTAEDDTAGAGRNDERGGSGATEANTGPSDDRSSGTGADTSRKGSSGSDNAGSGNGAGTGAASTVASVSSDYAERLDQSVTTGARLLQRVVGIAG